MSDKPRNSSNDGYNRDQKDSSGGGNKNDSPVNKLREDVTRKVDDTLKK